MSFFFMSSKIVINFKKNLPIINFTGDNSLELKLFQRCNDLSIVVEYGPRYLLGYAWDLQYTILTN